MNKNISKSKIFLALISLVITFFVWQEGLRDSLNRPSVAFDITQKEKEIAELAYPVIPENLKDSFFINDPLDEIKSSLSEISFNQLTERNKLIYLVTSDFKEIEIESELINSLKNKNYKLLIEELKENSSDNSYKLDNDFLDLFKEDRFLYHLLSKRFHLDESDLITNALSKRMFFKFLSIRLLPFLTIVFGSILVLKTLWNLIVTREIKWKDFKPLDLNLLDMVLLISGGFVVLGEVVSPLVSVTLVQIFSNNLPA